VYGSIYGIEAVTQKGDDLTLRFAAGEKSRIDRKRVDQLCLKHENRFKQGAAQDQNPNVLLRGKGLSIEQKLRMLEQFLSQYGEALETKTQLQNATS